MNNWVAMKFKFSGTQLRELSSSPYTPSTTNIRARDNNFEQKFEKFIHQQRVKASLLVSSYFFYSINKTLRVVHQL